MKAVRGRGLTALELVIVLGIIALLSSLAIQNILRARMTSNEATATGNLRGVMLALQMYQSQNNHYPSDWQREMYADADPPYLSASFNLPMTSSVVQGFRYTYTYVEGSAECPTTCSTYTLTANPETTGWVGGRAFFADHNGKIRHCLGTGPADATDPFVTDPPIAC